MPLDVNYVGRTSPHNVRDARGWVSSDLQDADVQIKNGPGILGGFTVVTEDNDGDQLVRIWDCIGAPGVGDEVLAEVRIPDPIEGTQNSFAAPSREGVEARVGLYLEITGDARVIVYYK